MSSHVLSSKKKKFSNLCVFSKGSYSIYDKTLIHLDDNSSSFEAISQVLDCFQSFSVFTLYKNMVNNGNIYGTFGKSFRSTS